MTATHRAYYDVIHTLPEPQLLIPAIFLFFLHHFEFSNTPLLDDSRPERLANRISQRHSRARRKGCIASTVDHLNLELTLHNVPHETVAVDDGSSDRIWQILQELKTRIPALAPVQNQGQHGFGRAVIHGQDHMKGDATVIMMADESAQISKDF